MRLWRSKINIFYIDSDPYVAAISAVDKHVVKMILESAQLLSTAHRYLDGEEWIDRTKSGAKIKRWRLSDAREDVLYKGTHINHPSGIWCRESIENYNWLVDHMFSLMSEYTHRYGKTHASYGELSYMLQSPPFNLKKVEATKMPCCMPQECIISTDPVENYRSYYIMKKTGFLDYTNRQPPEWLINSPSAQYIKLKENVFI